MTSKGWGPRGLFALAGAAFALASGAHGGVGPTAASGKGGDQAPRAVSGFVENKGQWNAKARFMGRGPGVTMWLEEGGVVLDYARPKGSASKYLGQAVGMRFVGGAKANPTAHDRRGVVDVLNGKAKGRGGKYGRVVESGVYKGVDFVAYFEGNTPRYDFVVNPGADASAVRLAFKGAKSVRVVDGHTLALGTEFGEQKVAGLFAYQTVGGKKVPVDVRFVRNAAGEVSFGLGKYDRTKPLVIDPLVYGTYFGGNAGFDEVRAVTTDTTGGTYVTGYTVSSQFPINYGPYGFNLKGGKDAFFSKLQGDAYNNDYSVYIGGSGDDQGNFLNVDAQGNVWVLGKTTSPDFPGTGAAPGKRGSMWLMRFAKDDARVLSPYIGGDESATGIPAVFRFGGFTPTGGGTIDAIDHLVGFGIPKPDGATPTSPIRLVIGGDTNGNTFDEIATPQTGEFSTAFYLTVEFDPVNNVFNVNQSRSGFVASRGATAINMSGLVVDRAGSVYMSGALFSNTNTDTAQGTAVFDTTAGGFLNSRLQRKSDIWVRKLNPEGAVTPTRANPLAGVVYSELVGGSSDDVTEGYIATRNFTGNFGSQILDFSGPTIAADLNGNAYIVGETASFDFPRTRGVFGPAFPASRFSVSVTKISASGGEILYSTNLGIGGTWSIAGISVDPRGQAYITGNVSRTQGFNATIGDPAVPNAASTVIGSIPTTADALRPTYLSPAEPAAKTDDGFLISLNADASDIVQGTYIGGILDDAVFAPYTDTFGDTFVYGWTDTRRVYQLRSSGTPPTFTDFILDSNLGPFITPGAFKGSPESASQGTYQEERNVGYWAFANPGSTAAPPDAPFLLFGNARNAAGMSYPFTNNRGVFYLRDGFILRFRLSLPLLSSLTLAPNPLPGGDAAGTGTPSVATATLTLSAAAPDGGAGITVTVDKPAVASLDPSSNVASTTVRVPAGATTVTFPVYTRAVTDVQNVQVRADYAGNVKVASLQVRPWLQSLTASPTTVVGGTVNTATIALEAVAPAPGVPVSLSTDSPNVIVFNTNPVTVPTGQRTFTFQYIALPTDTPVLVRVNASLLGVTRSVQITVNPARLLRIDFNPASIAAGSTTTGTVVLDGQTASARTIRLSVLGGGAGYTFSPAIVTIPAGASSAQFKLTTGFEPSTVTRLVQAQQIDGAGNTVGGPVSGAITIVSADVASITAMPSPVASGGTVTITATLASAAPAGGVNVTFNSSNPGLIPFGGTVPFAEGETAKSFTVNVGTNLTGADVPVQVRAFRTTNGSDTPKVATIIVQPVTATLTLTPNSVIGGNASTGRVTIPSALSQPVTVQLTSSDPASASVPASVTIPAGQTSATFQVATSPVPGSRTVTVTAQIGSGAPVSATLTVRSVQIVSLSLSPAFIRGGQTTSLTVTLDGPVQNDTTIALSYSNGSLISFPTIVIPAGQSSVTVRSNPASRVPRTLTTSISATLGGTTATTTLTVQR